VARRALHMALAFSLLYYWVPDPLPVLGVSKPLAALAGVGVAAVLEAWRIRSGWVFFLFRDYEKKWVAGYFWYGAGCVMALVFFEPRLAVPSILGVALVDPLLGEMRDAGAKRAAPAIGIAAWAGIAAGANLVGGAATPWALVPLGAVAAVTAETVKVPHIDDNFLMIAAPLLAMAGLAAVIGL
jgi:hypothetical protein